MRRQASSSNPLAKVVQQVLGVKRTKTQPLTLGGKIIIRSDESPVPIFGRQGDVSNRAQPQPQKLVRRDELMKLLPVELRG